MNKPWPNILATIAIAILMAGVIGFVFALDPKPSGPMLFIIAAFTALAVGVLVLIRFYFLIFLLKKRGWLGAVSTVVQISILLCLLYAFVFVLAAMTGVIGVTTNPPY